MNKYSIDKLNETTEAIIWHDFCIHHPNPVLRAIGFWLSMVYDFESSLSEADRPNLDKIVLTPLEVLEASNWQKYFAHHSHAGLYNVAFDIGGWIGVDLPHCH